MAQHGHARIHAHGVVDALADLHGAAHALGHDDHEVRVAGEAGILDALHHVLLKIDRPLRHQHGRRADGDADVEREEARVAAHDFDDRAALVRLHGVAQLVDTVDRGVAGGVEADRVVRAAHVVVDRGGPMATTPSSPSILQVATALRRPFSVMNSSLRAV